MKNFAAAERRSQIPTYKPGESESPSGSPPRFEVIPDLDLTYSTGSGNMASSPARYEDMVDLNMVSGIREKTNRGGKTVEELTTGSKEYVSVRRQLADFVYSEQFRTQGRDAISDTLINSIELFHLQVRRGDDGKVKHEEELNELVNLLNRVPESGGQREALVLQREGILELLDFVKDPFFCHKMWLLCQIGS